jgi:drug/metabolite transporter (DMT)-like permease
VKTIGAGLTTLQRAVLLGATAEAILSFMDALAKLLSARTPILELTFLRFAFGTVFASVLFAAQAPAWPTRDAIRYHSARSFLVVGAATSFFYGLSKLPIAETMALSFLAPLCIAVLGVVMLGERFTPRIGLGLLGGIIGMLIIVSAQAGAGAYPPDALWGVAAVLASAVFFAFVIILLRVRANTDPVPTIVLFQNAGPAAILAIPAVLVWRTPSWADLALFVVMGFLGVAGHVFMTNAFARAEAARLAPIHYLTLVYGAFYGWLLFGTIPGATTLIGAAIIVLATWMTQRR